MPYRHDLTASRKLAGFAAVVISLEVITFAVPLGAATTPFVFVLLPAWAALGISAMSGGRSEVARLTRRLVRVRVGARGYLVALGTPIVEKLVVDIAGVRLGASTPLPARRCPHRLYPGGAARGATTGHLGRAGLARLRRRVRRGAGSFAGLGRAGRGSGFPGPAHTPLLPGTSRRPLTLGPGRLMGLAGSRHRAAPGHSCRRWGGRAPWSRSPLRDATSSGRSHHHVRYQAGGGRAAVRGSTIST